MVLSGNSDRTIRVIEHAYAPKKLVTKNQKHKTKNVLLTLNQPGDNMPNLFYYWNIEVGDAKANHFGMHRDW